MLRLGLFQPAKVKLEYLHDVNFYCGLDIVKQIAMEVGGSPHWSAQIQCYVSEILWAQGLVDL